jgi:Fe-S-cluster containining protein
MKMSEREKTWADCIEQGWECERIANEKFWALFDEEKAKGHSDGEAARRVLCYADTERRRVSHAFHTDGMGFDEYSDGMKVLTRVAVQACSFWDKERREGRC